MNPTCHDLAELIESDPATAWTWDREGERSSPAPFAMAPVSSCVFYENEEAECA